MSKGGLVSTHQVFVLLLRFLDEQEYTVWAEVVSSLESFIFLYKAESFYPSFRKFALHLLSKVSHRLSLTGSNIDEEIAKVSKDPLKMVPLEFFLVLSYFASFQSNNGTTICHFYCSNSKA